MGSAIDGTRVWTRLGRRSLASFGLSTSDDVYAEGLALAAAAMAWTDVCGAGAPLTI